MEEQQSRFGAFATNKLKELGKTKEWLLMKLKEHGNYINAEQLDILLTTGGKSKARQETIGIILHKEEERQKLKKVARIK